MRKLYLFESLNYYIGDNLTPEMESKGVILTEDIVEGKTPKINVDETGVSIEWVEEVGDINVDIQ
jgi:hypothetical protein